MMHVQHLPPDAGHNRWTLRFTNHDGRRGVKVYAYEDEDTSKRLGQLIVRLIEAKWNGDAPSKDDAHRIAKLPPKVTSRLTRLGLLERRRIMRGRPLSEHIDAFELEVHSRGQNTAEHARKQSNRIRLIADGLHLEQFDDISQSDVTVWLNQRDYCTTTRRQYLVAMGDFCRWMTRDKRASVSPWEDRRLPRAESETPRRAFSVDEFRTLLEYLEGFERYPKQRTGWKASDRRLIYWFAASTGLRQNEIRSRLIRHLDLEHEPASIEIGWKDAKNRRRATIPLPRALAAALESYVGGMNRGDHLFPIPQSRNQVTRMFERDLIGAGIDREDDAGKRLDFHALRTTAIVWWLDVHGLSVKRAAVLARCSERTVERYARGFRLNDYSFLEHAPNVTGESGRVSGRSECGNAQPVRNSVRTA